MASGDLCPRQRSGAAEDAVLVNEGHFVSTARRRQVLAYYVCEHESTQGWFAVDSG